MPGLIIRDVETVVAGLRAVNWRDEPSLRLGDRSFGRRRRDVRFVVLHTTRGLPTHDKPQPQVVRAVPAPPSECTGRLTIDYWKRPTSRVGGAHVVVDADGTCLCAADLAAEAAYHCVGMNQISVGVEVVQQGDAALYQAQLDAVGVLCDFLAAEFGLPRVATGTYRNCRAQMADGAYAGGLDGVSFLGHRDASENRGFGDPGDFVMAAAVSRGEWATG